MGSIPFGLVIARILKIKAFQKGAQKGAQKEFGASHLAAAAGLWPAGALTFLLDFSKGALAVFLMTPVGYQFLEIFFGGSGDWNGVGVTQVTAWTSGLFVVLGHCYSPWLQFRGGKGVATSFGVIAVLSPLAALFGAIGFALVFLNLRIVSLASIAGLILASIFYLILNPVGIHLWLGAAMIFIVLLRHEANIDALLENREPKFLFKI
jgi:glycerol-3-phosphate acyltransferase PlsY